MSSDLIMTREIARLPERRPDAHKGDCGRIAVIGGCCGEVMMAGAPALTAIAAFRSGAGLVQVMVPEPLRGVVAVMAPHTTTRTLPTELPALLDAVHDFQTDAVALGPGMGQSLATAVLMGFLQQFKGPIVVDADGLNVLAATRPFDIPNPQRIVLTPHPGEIRRLLVARGKDRTIETTLASRREAACALVEAFGCIAVLKGAGTIVTNGERLYVNETGNAGMATGGTGDVLTGLIAGLIGQSMDPFEAAILAVYLHGLAGDFAAEELGRRSMTVMDMIDYLPEAICDHELSGAE
ncbi:MAG: NAD(P)H-hydrate dehydratase [Phycisphaerales bacterium]|nr:MAG: NAD(P)H-hydrate dehydratase [Phycisphaerales bacterium]